MDFEANSPVQSAWPGSRAALGDQTAPAIYAKPRGRFSPHPDELWNVITHGAGLVLSIFGSFLLMQTASGNGANPLWLVVGCGVYVCTLVAVYGASTLSHAFREPQMKRFFRMVDQGVIYLLIVGTFTPFALKYLTTGVWWLLLVTMWLIALAGFFSKVILAHRIDSVSLPPYVLVGWLPIMAIKPILAQLSTGDLALILAGGLCYTAGTLFLAFDRKFRYFHAVWHLLVIAGSACHYVVVLRCVAPQLTDIG